MAVATPIPDVAVMGHSVSRHLRIGTEAYDRAIRDWIPGYEAMLAIAADQVAAVAPSRVVELGAGTGGLSAVLLSRPGVGSVELIDIDPDMLVQARARLKDFGDRARYTQGSFVEPLPACDAAAASLSLHHLPDFDDRVAIFRRVWEALPHGGVFVNADVMMPTSGPAREAAFDAWAAHMALAGIDDEQARAHFAEWAGEDTYYPPETELSGLRDAGFEAECVWRDVPSTLLVARKP